MPTLFDYLQDGSGSRRAYSVAQVNEYAKRLLGADPVLSDVSVRGEISNLRRQSSGHMYFSIKDSEAVLRCAFFRADAARCRCRLADGMQVVARGSVTVYPRDGQFQLVVNSVEADGQGALYQLFEQYKRRLAEEGLFDASRKRQLPALPRRIAVVTSPTGAVLRDIARVARARMPFVSILLLPVQVQGQGAAGEIAAALRRASAIAGVDAVIVGRGGGSIEDLWAFNEPEVAYAIADCKKPVVSAVGHETDFTIADFTADVRAATPSNAAELLVPDCASLMRQTGGLRGRAARAMNMTVAMLRQRLDTAAVRPVLARPTAFIAVLKDKRRELERRAGAAVRGRLAGAGAACAALRGKAEALGPMGVLRRGYSIVIKEGRPVAGAAELAAGDEIELMFHDGNGKAKVM